MTTVDGPMGLAMQSAWAGSPKDMAPWGQAGRQSPIPSQKSLRTSLALPSTIARAPSWQAVTHRPQPSHFSSSIMMSWPSMGRESGSRLNCFFPNAGTLGITKFREDGLYGWTPSTRFWGEEGLSGV